MGCRGDSVWSATVSSFASLFQGVSVSDLSSAHIFERCRPRIVITVLRNIARVWAAAQLASQKQGAAVTASVSRSLSAVRARLSAYFTGVPAIIRQTLVELRGRCVHEAAIQT